MAYAWNANLERHAPCARRDAPRRVARHLYLFQACSIRCSVMRQEDLLILVPVLLSTLVF